MKPYFYLAAALVVCEAANSSGNEASPPRPPANTVQLGPRDAEIVVEVGPVKQARLQIPVGLLVAGKGRVGADAGRTPNLIAGLALTCAFVSGGFWLVRRGRSRGLAGLLLGLSLLGVGASTVWADRAAPAQLKFTPAALPAEVEIHGRILLEVVPTGDKIKLMVSKNWIKKTADKPKEN